MINALLHDLRNARRALLRSPWFSLIAVGMLGVGLGLCLFMTAVIRSHLLRPPPFSGAERMLHIGFVDSRTQNRWLQPSRNDFFQLRASQQSLESLEAFAQRDVALTGGRYSERVSAAEVSVGSFAALGVQPTLGALFDAADERPGSARRVLISDRLWRGQFDADPAVIGRPLRIDGELAEVRGVLPARFAFPFNQQLWLPMPTPGSGPGAAETGEGVDVWGLLRAGHSLDAASAEIDALRGRLPSQTSGELTDGVDVQSYMGYFTGPLRPLLGAMFVAVFAVLLIACANVAQLLFARQLQRGRELAIRGAIGASRGRLLRGGLLEALLLSLVASGLGLVLALISAEAAMAQLRAADYPPPYWMTWIQIDAELLFATLAAALLSTLLAGAWPAWRAAQSLQLSASDRNGTPQRSRIARSLPALQIALCLICLCGAGLTVGRLVQQARFELAPGNAEVLSAHLDLPAARYPDPADAQRFANELQASLQAQPGVVAAAFSSSVPYTGAASTMVAADGADAAPSDALLISSSPGYFASLGLSPEQGRDFSASDRSDSEPVAIISRALAERLWPAGVALGQRLRIGELEQDGADAPRYARVVGIVPHLPHDEQDRQRPAIYLPLAQAPSQPLVLLLRGLDSREQQARLLRQQLAAADPELPPYALRTLGEWTEQALHMPRLFAQLFSVLGGFALALAASGLYALLALQVGQRQREIGVRRALGASNAAILNLLFRQGLRQLAIGLLIGLPLAWAFGHGLRAVLPGLDTDFAVLLAICATVLLIALLAAGWLPARRALSVQPAQALHHE